MLCNHQADNFLQKFNIEDLQEKYDLAVDEVRDEVEKAISNVLTLRFGFEVEAVINIKTGVIDIYGYSTKGVLQIQQKDIKKPLLRDIKYSVINKFLLRTALKECKMLKKLIQTVVYGTVRKGCNSEFLYISIQDIDGREGVVGECRPESQTPKERGRIEGMTLPFYVLSVRPIYEGTIPRIGIELSRNSKGLPEWLLKKEVFKKNMDIKVKCVKRIAGAFSLVHVTEKIPRECIKKVSDELKERIIVQKKEQKNV